MISFFALLASAALAPQSSVETYRKHCTFEDFRVDGSYFDGPCTEVNFMGEPKLRVVYKFKGHLVTIVFGESQGQWSQVTINQEMGMRYQVSRVHNEFSTLNVNHISLVVE